MIRITKNIRGIQGRKIWSVVPHLLETTGINLDNGAGIAKLMRFKEHFHEYKIVEYEGLNCDRIMFEGQVVSSKRLNILYNDLTRHYHVIGNLTAALANLYLCNACGNGCTRDVTHTIRRVVTVWQALRVYQQEFESPVSKATDAFAARHVLIITRKNKVTKRPSVSVRGIACRATVASQNEKSTNVTEGIAKYVSRTKR